MSYGFFLSVTCCNMPSAAYVHCQNLLKLNRLKKISKQGIILPF